MREPKSDHFPHDFGSNGRCRIDGCDIYDRNEDDDRLADVERV